MIETRKGALAAGMAFAGILAAWLVAVVPAMAQEAIPIKGSREHAVIVRDLATLPPAVARTRARLLDAAERGDVQAFVAMMKRAGDAPRLSEGGSRDAAQLWAEAFPESNGAGALYEIARLLAGAGLRRADGSVEWPYYAAADFGRLPAVDAQALSVILGQAQFDEIKAGSYPGWRLSISAKGKWTAFVHG
jgi:hypothetical protein